MAIVVQAVPRSDGEESNPTRTACYSVETEGSSACPIRQTEPGDGSLYPAWSRDGRRLVILDNSGGSARLFVYNYDGTGKRMAALPDEQAKSPTVR